MPAKTDGSVILMPERFKGNVRDAIAGDPGDHRPTRRIAWVGQRSPLRDLFIQARLANGDFTPLQKKALHIAASRAVTAVPGGRRRIMEHDHPGALSPIDGLSKTYFWTEQTGFILEVAYKDADILLSLACAAEFADLDAREPDQPKPEPQLAPEWVPYRAIGGMKEGGVEVPLDPDVASGP